MEFKQFKFLKNGAFFSFIIGMNGTGEIRTAPMRFNRVLPIQPKICVVNFMHTFEII